MKGDIWRRRQYPTFGYVTLGKLRVYMDRFLTAMKAEGSFSDIDEHDQLAASQPDY